MQAKLVSCWSNIRRVTRAALTAKHLQQNLPLHPPLPFPYKCSCGLYPQILIFEISVDCCYTSCLLRVVILWVLTYTLWYHLRANAIHFYYCWFTLVQVLAHVAPHVVCFIILESHLLQPNHCNSPTVAKYTPMNMVWVTCIASGISQW